MSNEWKHIEGAIETVQGMLLKKKDIWTNGQGPFHQFDMMHDMGITPEHFAFIMTNLKMNRLKTVLNKHGFTGPEATNVFHDPDVEDSLVDLASYALLALGLIYRARSQNNMSELQELAQEYMTGKRSFGPCEPSPDDESVKIFVEKYIDSPEGHAEIEKLAAELTGEAGPGPITLGGIHAKEDQASSGGSVI